MIHQIWRALLLMAIVAVGHSAIAQETAPGLPSADDLKSAAEAAAANQELSEEQRTRFADIYSRIDAQLKRADEASDKAAGYQKALENAGGEAKAIRTQLEADQSEAEDASYLLPSLADLEAAEQLVRTERATLKNLEDRAGRISGNLDSEEERPEELRKALSENQALLERLGSQSVGTENASAAQIQAEKWLLAAQLNAAQAVNSRLETEQLSRPARMELLQAQRDRTAFDLRVQREKLKAYDQQVLALRQEQARKALDEVASVQQSVADAHPAIQSLAEANTLLSADITARTAALEQLRQQEDVATETAIRFETDLKNIQRKLAVLGMSEALGKVLREQQVRLPNPLYGRADVSRREKLMAEASLKQLTYEDERRSLQSLSGYVDERLADVDPDEAQLIRDDMLDLARTRRDLVKNALDVETTYLRALGDLDFAVRRVETSALTYRDFISERLLWIRSAPAFSFDTLKPLPGEVLDLLSPVHWWKVVVALPRAMLGSVLYPAMLLLFAMLLRYHRRLLDLLERTGDNVGHVAKDTYRSTLEGLGLTALLAATWPLLISTLGLALEAVDFEGRMERSVGFALHRSATYFFGLEFLRYLLIPQGLVRRHFRWAKDSVVRISRKVWQLESVFVPMVVVAIVANRAAPQEGISVLTSIALIVALIALSRFFMLTPSLAQGELKNFISLRSAQRQTLLGRMLRYFMTALPLALVVCILLGFTHTATEFLSSLVGTLALFTALLLLHELGVRWLRIMRLRLIEGERLKAEQAAREAAENPDADVVPVEDFAKQNPDELDSEGRNLLNTALAIIAIVGTWGVWSDLLPALGILDSVALWNTTELVDGVETLTPVTPLDIVQVVLVIFAGYVAVQRIPALLDLFLRQKMELASGTVYASVTLGRYALVTTFVITVLGMLGANWSQIQWAVAGLGVGIGFGLQEIVANFICGIILLFEQPIRVGDTITVGETSGIVTKIRMRATTVRDWDGRELLVPNKEFITGRLLNWSLSDQQTRLLIEIGVAYGSDVPRAMKLALDAAHEHDNVLGDPEPFITFDAFGDNALMLTLRCYLPSLERRLTTGSELRNSINDKFNEAGIVIAFPQRDVHINGIGPIDVNVRNMNELAAE